MFLLHVPYKLHTSSCYCCYPEYDYDDYDELIMMMMQEWYTGVHWTIPQ